jgi:uncharacterized protein YkwD
MPPRRRQRRNGRALPTVVAVIIGLAVAGGIYWHQNPDFELRLPRGLVDRVAGQSSREQVPESFAAMTATSTPDVTSPSRTTPTSGAAQVGQLRHLVPQVSGESREEREARTRMEAAARVSELELKVHAGINAERAKNGGSSLKWEKQLAAVARAHSVDMTSHGYFSHDTPEGLGPSDRIDRAGYSCWKSSHYGVAENIAIETTLGDLDRTAAEAVRGWMNSPGHRTNLLGRQYDRTGVGASFGTWRGYKAVYLTQVFC